MAKTSKILTRESFLASATSGYKKALIELPIGSAYIREMSTKTMLSFKDGQEDFKNNEALAIDAIADVVIECVCDKSGVPLFSGQDKEIIAAWPLTLLTEILSQVLMLSGVPASMLESAVLEAKENLKNGPTTSSSSDLPKSSD